MNRVQEKGHAVEGVPYQDQSTTSILSFEPSGSTKYRQQNIVLTALRSGPQSTLDLRALHVMSPAARCMDLRRQGLNIVTLRKGRCAVYVLREDEA